MVQGEAALTLKQSKLSYLPPLPQPIGEASNIDIHIELASMKKTVADHKLCWVSHVHHVQPEYRLYNCTFNRNLIVTAQIDSQGEDNSMTQLLLKT